MSLPEWGYSYNALCVPLTSDWQCSLVPARDLEDVDRGWKLSYEERQKKRKEREEQIEQDRRDFERLFRVSISRRDARACSEFGAYVAFIREHLCISGLGAPVDGEDVTRILRDAVRDGWLIPAIDRAWRGSRRVTRFYAPQSWPKRAPDPKPTVYGVRNGQFIPIGADGCFVDRTPYVPVAAVMSKAASFTGADDDAFTPLDGAQPFEYGGLSLPGGEAVDLAGLPFDGPAGSWTESGPNMKKQWRMYGSNGAPVVDIDFDSHHGQPNPHAHNWDGRSRDQGWPVSILP